MLAGADQIERLVVAAVLLARNERVDRHHAGLALRGDKDVLLVYLLEEEQHVTAPRGESQGYLISGITV